MLTRCSALCWQQHEPWGPECAPNERKRKEKSRNPTGRRRRGLSSKFPPLPWTLQSGKFFFFLFSFPHSWYVSDQLTGICNIGRKWKLHYQELSQRCSCHCCVICKYKIRCCVPTCLKSLIVMLHLVLIQIISEIKVCYHNDLFQRILGD